jgi:hypothetical protein
MNDLIIKEGAKVLEKYFQVLVDDGLLEMGSVTPYDCEFLVKKMYEAMNEVAIKESAL